MSTPDDPAADPSRASQEESPVPEPETSAAEGASRASEEEKPVPELEVEPSAEAEPSRASEEEKPVPELETDPSAEAGSSRASEEEKPVPELEPEPSAAAGPSRASEEEKPDPSAAAAPSRTIEEEKPDPEPKPEQSAAAGSSRTSEEEKPDPDPKPEQSAAAGPSRTSEEEKPDPEAKPEPSAAAVPPKPQVKRWLVLSAVATVLDTVAPTHLPGVVAPLADVRVRMLLLPGADLALDNHPAPRASCLLLSKRVAPDAQPLLRFDMYPYVHAADPSAVVLFRATERPGADRQAFFIGDALTRVVRRIPHAPLYRLRPRRGVGLIADPRRRGTYIVAQLEPSVPIVTRHTTLLCYSTATDLWNFKLLASAPEQERRWGAHGVLAHQGHLWWVDVAYGLLVCDPFLDSPHLRFVELPPGCEIQGDIVHRTLIDDRRIVRLSEGKLRYVEIRGDGVSLADILRAEAVDEHLDNPILCMWTLLDPDALHPWRLEYEVPLAEVWAHDTYIAADLPPNVVPKLGLVHPYNYGIVCLFQGAKLFALDVRTRRVLACQECRIDNDPDLRFQSSPYVHAWELPAHEIVGYYPPSGPAAQSDLRMKQSVESWLDQLEPGLAPSDEEQWQGAGMVGSPVDSSAPSDSSPDMSDDQVDEL